MGGGHGPHIVGNPNNIQEADAELAGKIRSIELIKHNPQLFHRNLADPMTVCELMGGAKTAALGVGMGVLFAGYYLGGRSHAKTYNFYINTHVGFFRFFLGTAVGLGIGHVKWGDRQAMHNAWVAERLRKRYPAAMNLNAHDLWQYKGVPASHQFYQYK